MLLDGDAEMPHSVSARLKSCRRHSHQEFADTSSNTNVIGDPPRPNLVGAKTKQLVGWVQYEYNSYS
jgi:hypothetical protein